MQMRFKYSLLLCLIFTSISAFSQEPVIQTDSTGLYENIEAYSRRSKFTRFMYRLFFKPVAPDSLNQNVKKKAYKKLIQKPYSEFQGKIIRDIKIVTLDPFGNTIGDTIVASRTFLVRTGNLLHIKTQPITLRNILVIRENQRFDSLLVKESERLIRSQPYVRDVSFNVKPVSKNSDSVDIFIRELDTWSIIPDVAPSPSRVWIRLTERNFIGLGHEFGNTYTWYPETGDDAFSTKYYVPNISNTYINTTLVYGTDEFRNFTKGLSVSRPFYSPFARWAGGIAFSQEFRTDSIQIDNSKIMLQRFKFNAQDYWAGHAFRIFKRNTERGRTTNLISAARFLRVRYLEKPDERIDTLGFFTNENFYIGSLGISERRYVQDKYIFQFGITEDVPLGRVYNLTAGYLHKNGRDHMYFGGRVSHGHYFPWGYLTSSLEYGSFFYDSKAERGILTAGANYFTGLIEIEKWKFRQFVKIQADIGVNRFPHESLTLNEGVGIEGFNSSTLTGTSRLLFRLQTQSYAPWNFIGFRFGPYVALSLGMVGDAGRGFKNSTVYSKIGLGALIKNDYLIVNTFEISIAYYPNIPGIGRDVLKINSFKATDFGFRDFEIGKPAPFVYQ
jgi:hypothetical protein